MKMMSEKYQDGRSSWGRHPSPRFSARALSQAAGAALRSPRGSSLPRVPSDPFHPRAFSL